MHQFNSLYLVNLSIILVFIFPHTARIHYGVGPFYRQQQQLVCFRIWNKCNKFSQCTIASRFKLNECAPVLIQCHCQCQCDLSSLVELRTEVTSNATKTINKSKKKKRKGGKKERNNNCTLVRLPTHHSENLRTRVEASVDAECGIFTVCKHAQTIWTKSKIIYSTDFRNHSCVFFPCFHFSLHRRSLSIYVY